MIEFEEKMQKKSTFSADYLVVSGKSSTFACFFAARERICVYVAWESGRLERKTNKFKLT